MIRRGFARVYSFLDNRALVAELLDLEEESRNARRGIWGLSYYKVRMAEPNAVKIGRFELVEGKVTNAAIVRGRAYLNFGTDWRSDVTASVAPKHLGMFKREGYDLIALTGRQVRLRGWVDKWNGPMIRVTHPEQIELLDD